MADAASSYVAPYYSAVSRHPARRLLMLNGLPNSLWLCENQSAENPLFRYVHSLAKEHRDLGVFFFSKEHVIVFSSLFNLNTIRIRNNRPTREVFPVLNRPTIQLEFNTNLRCPYPSQMEPSFRQRNNMLFFRSRMHTGHTGYPIWGDK